MEAGQYKGLVSLVLGIYTLLVAAGVFKVGKTPEASAAFLRKYKWLFVLVTVFLIAYGATHLAGLYW